jgi:hypothetical protein
MTKPRITKLAIAFFGIVLTGLILFAVFSPKKPKEIERPEPVEPPAAPAATPETISEVPRIEVLGFSVENRQIDSYTFGNGETLLAFAGGMHGGYEWNSVLLAYQLIDYLGENPDAIPQNLAVAVIPSINPDGVFKITNKVGRFAVSDIKGESNEAGRFNARGVDLNRNFDCNWKPEAVWKGNKVSGGSAAFSEPESQAIRKFVQDRDPAAFVFWHSQSNTIYGSQCGGGMLPETVEIMDVYSKASGYRTAPTFDLYEVSGDATDWLASIGKPAMTVELATHKTIEWERNLAGIKALFEYYKNKQPGSAGK